MNTLLSFMPFVLILLLSLSLFAVFSKFLKDKSLFLLFSVLLAIPIIMGLFLYFLFFAFPGNTNIFYISAISLPIFLLALHERKGLLSAFGVIRRKWKILKSQPLDLFSKILLFAILFVLTLVFLRTIFWPINWVDQIYYLKQAYVFSQTHSLDLFLNWGFFHDSQISNYQMNPAIRPGLPMIFTTTFLFNSSLRAAQFFCQTIIFYYFLLTSCVVFYVSWKIAKIEKTKVALVSLFLMLFTYTFIYHSISGFKEILIIPITLLVIFYISSEEKFLAKLNPYIYMGILLGLISFINYSGALISLFILLIFVTTKRQFHPNIISALKTLLFIIIFSGFEFFVFLNLVTPNIFPLVEKDAVVKNDIENNFPTHYSDAAKNEFAMYNFTSLKDLYLKGKFQWLFQIQYFGLIFVLFITVAISTYKNLIKNPFIKNVLFFLLIYALMVFDPLNINRSEFGYVLSINAKYSALLVPFVAIVIAYQLNWIEKMLKKINLTVLVAALSSFFILNLIFFKNNPDRLFKTIAVFFPALKGHDGYAQGLKLLNDIYLILLAVILIPLIYLLITKKERVHFLFRNSSAATILFLTIFFAFPFLFFYNSNFGFKNTFIHSFDKNPIKLEKTSKWEKIYSPLKYVNALPINKKMLFIDQPIKSIDIHLNIPINNIYQVSDLPGNKDLNAIKQMGISYIYARKNSKLNDEGISKIAGLEILEEVDENIIFKVKF